VTGVGWLGVIAFVVGILLSIMIHEWGHFVAARRFGCKVTEFFVGFGTRLWSVRRGETEYGVKAIPAGGYVKIIGMTDLEPVAEEDRPRAFYNKPAWQRAVTLCAGSFMHLVIGLVLFFVAFVAFGAVVPDNRAVIGAVSACVPVSATSTGCQKSDPASPAKTAGLKAGDRVVSVDGKPVSTWQDLTTAIRAKPASQLDLVVERGGKPVHLQARTVSRQRPDLNHPDRTVTVGAIGIAPPPDTVARYGPVESVGKTLSQARTMVAGSVTALVGLPAKVGQLFGVLFNGQPRDPNGAVGVVGISRISGDVAQSDLSVAAKISTLLMLLAGFNIFIGIFNMLPLLPLDGGHVAILAYERFRAWLARRKGLPEPPRPDLNKLLPLAYAVLVLFVGVTVLLLAADIFKPIQL
jgi:membrane-associated protease RseP (regulator of RpoE activity)